MRREFRATLNFRKFKVSKKAKIKGVFSSRIVAMVTCYIKRMTATSLSMNGEFV